MSDLRTSNPKAATAESPTGSAAHDVVLDLKARIGKSVLGQDHLVESMLIGLLANGNLLIESLSGLAKTRAVSPNRGINWISLGQVDRTRCDPRATASHNSNKHRSASGKIS
jgi:hypothetical protein